MCPRGRDGHGKGTPQNELDFVELDIFGLIPSPVLSPRGPLPTVTQVDAGVFLAFAGISADGRVLASKIRLECQNYRYSMGAAPSVGYIAKFVGQ